MEIHIRNAAIDDYKTVEAIMNRRLMINSFLLRNTENMLQVFYLFSTVISKIRFR